MKTPRVSLCLVLALGLVVPAAIAQGAPAQAPAKDTVAARSGKPPMQVTIPIKEHRLKNGLRVILAEDHYAPTYSVCMTYNVGSRDERPGRTGFAHLFEHMMFQGSEGVGKGEHFILVFSG